MRIIVNADDCGLSEHVNFHIRKAIESHRVTSTTIMANMNDFDGAIKIYNDLRNIASFGIHITLTEGEPLIRSQVLLDSGFLIMKDGNMLLNGKGFRYKNINKNIRNAIKTEIEAQVQKILDSGIKISHLDSHHHIHTSPFILPIVEEVAKEFHILKIRRIGDTAMKKSAFLRMLWMMEMHYYNKHIRTSDYFYSYDEFITVLNSSKKFQDDCVIELMCHPGGVHHPKEEQLMLDTDLERLWNATLITYNDL